MYFIEYSYLGDIGSSTISFQNSKELLKGKDQPQFSSILNTASCLVATVEADHDDISHVIEMVNGMKVERKFLRLIMESLDISLLQNKTISYNVGMYQIHTGNIFQILPTALEVLYIFFLDDLVSLCPVVGKRWAQIVNGACPKHTQSPHGKELNISFIGHPPFITYMPIGGSEFLLMRLLAQKFNFRPKFIPERSYGIVKVNGTLYGRLHAVGEIFLLGCICYLPISMSRL